MSRTVILSALAAIILALGGTIYMKSQGAGLQQPLLAVNAEEATATVTEAAAEEVAPEVVEMALGDAEAPITVIEYASMTCPHCARFHDEVYPQLRDNYIETGQVRFVFREVYFDRYGLWAGMVARCGGEMRYFGIVEMLMEDQREWVQGDPSDVADNLRRLGRSAGLADDQLDACLTDNETAQAMLALSTEQAEADQITGTPSFVINGQLYSNMGYADFSETLDGLLAAAE